MGLRTFCATTCPRFNRSSLSTDNFLIKIKLLSRTRENSGCAAWNALRKVAPKKPPPQGPDSVIFRIEDRMQHRQSTSPHDGGLLILLGFFVLALFLVVGGVVAPGRLAKGPMPVT